MTEDQSSAGISLGYLRWLPWFGLVWAGALWLTTLQPRLGLITAGVFVVIIPLVTLVVRPDRPRWLVPVTTFFFLLSSLVALSVMSLVFWQWATIGIGGVMLAFLLHHHRDMHDRLSGRELNVIVALILFFTWLILLSFGNGIFFVWPWWWLAIGGALVMTVAASLLWTDNGLRWSTYSRVLPLVAALGAGLTVVVWWLPTVIFVGAIVAATASILWLQTLQHIWRGSWEAGRGRRYVVVATAIIVVVLATARWN